MRVSLLQYPQQMLQAIPEPVKLTGDTLAIIGWVSALSGVVTNVFGALAAVCSFVWAALRLHEEIKKRRNKKD